MNIDSSNPRDQEQCENTPSPFAAEQTWPTEEEFKHAQNLRHRRTSEEEKMEQIDTSSKPEFQVPLSIIPTKQMKNTGEKSLEEMFERMEIKVVGRENEEVKSQASLEEEDDEDEEFDLNKSYMEDPNKIS